MPIRCSFGHKDATHQSYHRITQPQVDTSVHSMLLHRDFRMGWYDGDTIPVYMNCFAGLYLYAVYSF